MSDTFRYVEAPPCEDTAQPLAPDSRPAPEDRAQWVMRATLAGGA